VLDASLPDRFAIPLPRRLVRHEGHAEMQLTLFARIGF
jgi:hypothetical protein